MQPAAVPQDAGPQESRPAESSSAVELRLDGVPPDIADQWRQVLGAVKATGNWTLHSFLTHVRPAGVEDDSYIVEVAPGEKFFRKNLGQREYKRAVEDKIAEVYGRHLQFVCRINESIEPVNNNRERVRERSQPLAQPQPQSVPKREGPRKRKRTKRSSGDTVSAADRAEVSNDEGVRHLMDLFGGKLSAVRKLELEGES